MQAAILTQRTACLAIACFKPFLQIPMSRQPTNCPSQEQSWSRCANSQVEWKSFCPQRVRPQKLQEDSYFQQLQLRSVRCCSAQKTIDKSSSFSRQWIQGELVTQLESLAVTAFSTSLHSYCSLPSPLHGFPNTAKLPKIQNRNIKRLAKRKFPTKKNVGKAIKELQRYWCFHGNLAARSHARVFSTAFRHSPAVNLY